MPPPRSTASHGKGPIEPSRKDLWVLAAKRAILELVEDQLAVIGAELEARLSDTGVRLDGKPHLFDPHILSEALRELEALGAIGTQPHVTKGGGEVTVIVPADRARRQTAINKRVARKSMLYRRFLALSRTAGEAGEQVLRHSMQAAVDAGAPYLPMHRRFGEVQELLRVRPYGPFDSGAWLHNVDANDVPTPPVALPIEVKNRRLTLYPIHKEVHQLLSKAALIQEAHPDYPVAPVLICRKAHARLFWMAADLGFRVWSTRRQFVYQSKDIDERKINEVRDELGIADLTIVDRDRPPTIEVFLQRSLPKQAGPAADSWSTYAATVRPYADRLRSDRLTPFERQGLIHELREEVVDLHREWEIEPPYTWAAGTDEDLHAQDGDDA